METGYRLVMRTGPSVGMVYPLDKNELFIGRDLGNDIPINDPEVSRRHARIFLQGTNYIIEDLGSTNGTSVNGQRIMGPYMLRPGELVVFGEQVSLLFEAVQTDSDATVVSGSKDVEDFAPVYQSSSPQPAHQPSYQQPAQQPQDSPYASHYAGQVPSQPEYDELQAKKKFPVWLILIIVLVLLIVCVCGVGLYFIDANDMWCDLFGFIFNAIAPGSCPN